MQSADHRHLWIDIILDRAYRARATEIRLNLGEPPTMYVQSQFVRIRDQALSLRDVTTYIQSTASDEMQLNLERDGNVSFDFAYGDVCRCFVTAHKNQSHLGMRIRTRWLAP